MSYYDEKIVWKWNMVFSSLIFVLLFLPLNILCHSLAKNIRSKNTVMLIFSLVFYTFAGVRYLLLFFLVVFLAWLSAILVDKAKTEKRRKTALILGVASLLCLLGVFKYTGFFLENIQLIAGFPEIIPDIALPLGISFYTFQLLSYVVDVYRRDVEVQKNYFVILLYAGLFHQCVAGPILRYSDVEKDIFFRRVTSEDISRGISRFTSGLFKKAILANYAAELSERLLGTGTEGLLSATSFGVFLGCFCYMLQIYLDFSAYSDMAIGMGHMAGFSYKENFNYPYAADSVTDFWRRWHISLSSFFRDYVYIPLGGNRCSALRQVFNMFVVWSLTGFWHGASWNYILWGLYYFIFLLIEKYPLKNVLPHIPKLIRSIALLLIVYFGWILFKFESFDMIKAALTGLFVSPAGLSSSVVDIIFKNNVFFLIIASLACTPIVPYISSKTAELAEKNIKLRPYINAAASLIPPMLLFLSACALAGDSYNPFLYFIF